MLAAFKNRVAQNKVPSSLLFVGSKEKINLSFAKNCAKQLMGEKHRQKIDSGNHPDLYIYSLEGKSALHPMSSIQHLIEQTHLPPFEAAVKVFIIEEAEKMLPSSSNALLKILEEPPLDNYLILLTHDKTKLLPTILSRVSPIYDDSVSQSQIAFRQNLLNLFHHVSHSDTVSLLKEISYLENQFFSEELEVRDYAAQVELLFEQILYWFRDLELLTLKVDSRYLYYQEAYEELKQFPSHLSIKEIFRLIEKSRIAVQRNIKLKNVLANFFLNFN